MELLSGEALLWVTTSYKPETKEMPVDAFIWRFRTVFDHSAEGKEVSDILLFIRQGAQGL